MPEALARTDFDYSVSSNSGRRGRGAIRTRRDGIFASMRRVSMTTILAAGFAAVAITAVVNALLLQDGPHPAPLFASGEPAKVSTLPRVGPAVPPERPAQTVEATTPETPPAAAIAPRTVVKPRVAPATTVAAVPGAKDGIGDFLRTGTQPTAAASADASATVLAVQKALARAGHDVGKPDGRIGPATRLAIEKFERDRKLPVTGDVSARLLRELNIPPAKI